MRSSNFPSFHQNVLVQWLFSLHLTETLYSNEAPCALTKWARAQYLGTRLVLLIHE